ncbi:SDR family NAD(P)-dependent oxidoreductase [uncultured Zhongshania sp.]|jgi:NAD(P)-dependent dehydrogenase (short-subunit alcohol dehydrogenase family)|uniref:SDR family NAD(P)-dependent oxidoreductase n=1 Tax=uncultured Zhongshania sp. TaxID=1642288 RepID=UPI0025EB532D|nr:SDR family NAD(P)-dependent oxidoreductase [uncultured Zhongshania sp.]|tara:strand:- start:923 stop:1687 length:765 start_codon:yes stop_codon:yes gene_type:complete
MTGVLRGKIALVTGGATGIGHAICEQLAIEGASVALIDINRDAGETAALALQRHGVESAFFYCDVSDEQQISAMVTAVLERFGRLDIACNNAALSRGSGPIHQFSRAVFDQTLEMCLTNTWLCMKYELEAMLAQGAGAIVNISSNASLRGQAFNTAYAAAKGGVNILTKSAAAEYAAQGVRINAVSPGVIRTPGLENYFKEQPKAEEQMNKVTPMRRLGEPSEIANAVAFLLSEKASFITGQLLSVDGGGAVRG